MTTVEYTIGAELPDTAITWTDESGNLINFSSGWTFTVKVGDQGKTALLTKSTGITGAAAAPNLTIAWAAGELDGVGSGAWACQVTAHNTASAKDRIRTFSIKLLPAIA
jgi:hypothetical protein